jgi:hypothetical protein
MGLMINPKMRLKIEIQLKTAAKIYPKFNLVTVKVVKVFRYFDAKLPEAEGMYGKIYNAQVLFGARIPY